MYFDLLHIYHVLGTMWNMANPKAVLNISALKGPMLNEVVETKLTQMEQLGNNTR